MFQKKNLAAIGPKDARKQFSRIAASFPWIWQIKPWWLHSTRNLVAVCSNAFSDFHCLMMNLRPIRIKERGVLRIGEREEVSVREQPKFWLFRQGPYQSHCLELEIRPTDKSLAAVVARGLDCVEESVEDFAVAVDLNDFPWLLIYHFHPRHQKDVIEKLIKGQARIIDEDSDIS